MKKDIFWKFPNVWCENFKGINIPKKKKGFCFSMHSFYCLSHNFLVSLHRSVKKLKIFKSQLPVRFFIFFVTLVKFDLFIPENSENLTKNILVFNDFTLM